MKTSLAIVVLVAGTLAVQSGCRCPHACAIVEPACCPAQPSVACVDPAVHSPTEAEQYVAEQPLGDDAILAPFGSRAYQLYDPVAPLPPSQPLSGEQSVLR